MLKNKELKKLYGQKCECGHVFSSARFPVNNHHFSNHAPVLCYICHQRLINQNRECKNGIPLYFGRNCTYCGKVMDKDNPPTFDHVIPKCMGGRRKVLCCLKCNQKKGIMPVETFLDKLNLEEHNET